jgi:hypothetical protein
MATTTTTIVAPRCRTPPLLTRLVSHATEGPRRAFLFEKREVTLDPSSAGFRRLVAELSDTPGLYWLEHRGLALKVGQSQSGIGRRLASHVGVAFHDMPSHRKFFPAWHCFIRALVGRRITVRWQECPPAAISTLNELEREAIHDADPLWERMKHDDQALKAHPDRQPDFTAAVTSFLDGW